MNDNMRKIMKGDVTMTSRPPHAPMPQRQGHGKAVAKVMQKDGRRKDCALLLRLFILITPHAHNTAPTVVALLCGLCCGLLTERDIWTEVLRKEKRHFREPNGTFAKAKRHFAMTKRHFTRDKRHFTKDKRHFTKDKRHFAKDMRHTTDAGCASRPARMAHPCAV